MASKYSIEKIDNNERWQEFAIKSQEYTIFVNPVYLDSLDISYQTFFVKKGIEIKASFVLTVSNDEKNIIHDEFAIYSGILFNNDSSQKRVKKTSEKFEISELVIDYLEKNYNSISLQLSPMYKDMRPFLWFNYHSSDESKKFKLNLRYTSYCDISEINNNDEEETLFFKNLDTIRQRNIRKARKEQSTTNEELNVELFLKFYSELMLKQGELVSEKKLSKISKIINSLVLSGDAVMLTTRNSNQEIIYLMVFAVDKNRAYYLFGAGNLDAPEKYKGTICFWDSFKILSSKYNIKIVDMEGINSPKRGWFKLSFGGTIVPYYKVSLGE